MMVRYLVDGHLHADGLPDVDLETLARFEVRQVLVCAHDGGLTRRDRPTTLDWLTYFDHLLSVELARFKRHGLWPLLALGIHPTAAPWQGLEELLHKLPRYLSHPAVVAIGALGLRHFDEQETYILRHQLEMAAEFRRPVLLSPPVREPASGLRKLASLIKQSEVMPDRVLIEQVWPNCIGLVRACGFYTALEPSPGRLSLRDVSRLIQKHGSYRFVLTSHAGEGAADLLTVPMLAARLADDGLSDAVINRVAGENMLRFLRREESVRQARVG